MVKRYRFLALVSWAILAYFLLASQYLYQDLGVGFSGLIPILNNSSTSGFSRHPVHNNNKKEGGPCKSPHLNISGTVCEVVKQLPTSRLKSGKKDLNVMDPVAKGFSVIKDATREPFNLKSDQGLQRFRTRALKKQRQLLKDEMRGFHFPPNRSLSDFVMEMGGDPVRSLVFATWRSGSTFLGDILQSNPGTFYHCEPLDHFGIVQVREVEHSKEALRVVGELLNCRYQSLDGYMKHGERHHWIYKVNKRIGNFCHDTHQVCWDSHWLSAMCRMFPFQAMKTVRMRLNLARPLLQDKKLNVRILYLVRDPRGTMPSRWNRDFCPGQPDCEEPARLCKDLVSDFYAAQTLRQDFPDRFMIVRYEDMAGSIYNAAKKILKFFRMPYDPKVKRYLDTHTKYNIGGESSTFRDTKSAPFHWMQDLAGNFTVVETIQNCCREAMALWKYDVIERPEGLKGFNPLMDAPWKDMNILPVD